MSVDWTTENQRVLAAEFARLKSQLANEEAPNTLMDLYTARESLSGPAAIDRLAAAFQLSVFERDILLLCAGVEMDASLAARCAEASGTLTNAQVTFGLALATLPDPHWSSVTPSAPLRRWRLIEVVGDHRLVSGRLVIDERILHYLAGINCLDERLRSQIREHRDDITLSPTQVRVVEAATRELNSDLADSGAVQLAGSDPASQRQVAIRISESRGLRLHITNAKDLPTGAHEAEAVATLWSREAVLLPSALLVIADDSTIETAQLFARRVIGLVFVATSADARMDGASRRYVIDLPSESEQRQLWVEALGSNAGVLNGSLNEVASQFRMSSETIHRISRTLQETPASDLEGALWKACRETARSKMQDLAQRVDSRVRWEDLVLPDPQLEALRQIAAHVRQRLKVHEHWGFAEKSGRGLGISALFTGESGTGKTMAAELIANELQLDLYRIDLAATVSKYIGETEKNLSRIFDAAEDSGAVLLFDEADALFGKRSEVNDSRDRYANIEVSYLLQRMEEYRGLAILTTNLKNILDPAFLRRLRFVVQFPFPDNQQREQIWRGVFPAGVPLQNVHPGKLAQLNVAGGSIRNIALNAAFLAADEGSSVDMCHLLRAARSEAAKRERPFSDAETRGWL
jgi:AraC-like DNA-binding protein